MSACIPTAAEAATTSISPSFYLRRNYNNSNANANPNLVRFPLYESNHKLRLFSSQRTHSAVKHTVAAKAQLNNVSVDGSSSASEPPSKSEAPAQDTKIGKPSGESVASTLATEDSVSEFITQVAGLVRLVDSRDIVELQLKQHDCELLIRKKEAIAQASPPPVIMMQPPSSPAVAPQAHSPASAPMASPAASAPPALPAAKPAKSSVPALKSPMAGTFYRSPAPGAPPFVKVGDKVQKGQVLCIVEAMKLMNEIEADQSGTLVEIVAEDGKPVSVDTPLFVIQP